MGLYDDEYRSPSMPLHIVWESDVEQDRVDLIIRAHLWGQEIRESRGGQWTSSTRLFRNDEGVAVGSAQVRRG